MTKRHAEYSILTVLSLLAWSFTSIFRFCFELLAIRLGYGTAGRAYLMTPSVIVTSRRIVNNCFPVVRNVFAIYTLEQILVKFGRSTTPSYRTIYRDSIFLLSSSSH